MKHFLIAFILTTLVINTFAQKHFSISGVVKDEKGVALLNATVFLSGSQKIMCTTADGKFSFPDVAPGTYKLATAIAGYMPYAENIDIKDSSSVSKITLQPQPPVLGEVVIGKGDSWDSNYRTFKEKFLGPETSNSDCEILNPHAITFGYSKKTGMLTAYTDQFLIINNKKLGYRVCYQLMDFEYNKLTNATVLDGDANFEELEGTPKMKNKWEENRLAVYNGSLMHFLRSVFNKRLVKEGFIANSLIEEYVKMGQDGPMQMMKINNRPMGFDSLVNVIDSSFIRLTTNQFYLAYDPKRAANLKISGGTVEQKDLELTANKGTLVKLANQDTIIDSKGCYAEYQGFVLRGNLAHKRIGDQLPFEYQPPTN